MRLQPIDPDHDAGPEDVPPAGRSALDELRAVYTAIEDEQVQTRVFDVEGSNAAIRYRRIPFKQVTAALSGEGDLWERNAQLLIESCDEIGVRNSEGDFEPLIPGQKVTFDLRPGESTALHKALGVEETDVRRSVLRLFQGVDQALLRHAADVDAWMGSLRGEAADLFQGE